MNISFSACRKSSSVDSAVPLACRDDRAAGTPGDTNPAARARDYVSSLPWIVRVTAAPTTNPGIRFVKAQSGWMS